MINLFTGLGIGLLAAIIVWLVQRLKLNYLASQFDICITNYMDQIAILKKDKADEAQRADLLAKANEELQEDFNKTELKYNRLYAAHDALRARIRRSGDARKYDLSVVIPEDEAKTEAMAS